MPPFIHDLMDFLMEFGAKLAYIALSGVIILAGSFLAATILASC